MYCLLHVQQFSCCIGKCRSNVYFMHENLLHMAIVTDSSTCNVTTSFPGSLFSASLTLGMRYATWSATFCREMLPVQLCLGLNRTFSFAYWHVGIEISDGTVCAHWFNKVIIKGNFITVLKRAIYSRKITETQKASQHSKLLHYLLSYTTNTKSHNPKWFSSFHLCCPEPKHSPCSSDVQKWIQYCSFYPMQVLKDHFNHVTRL